jgi:hypothetical protein
MRLTLAAPALAALLALSACSGGTSSTGGPNTDDRFYPNCAEQAELARNGTTEGNQITITCP